MKPYFSMRYNKLDEQQKDIVEAGVELFRHFRYENSKSESEKVSFANMLELCLCKTSKICSLKI